MTKKQMSSLYGNLDCVECRKSTPLDEMIVFDEIFICKECSNKKEGETK